MDKLLQVFQYNGAQVRVATLNGEPAFVAKDVCEILGLTNVSLAVNGNPTRGENGLSDDEKGVCNVNTPGGFQEMLCVTESGLYALIFKSRRIEAEAFRRWVTHEVLPAIRKTGSYSLDRLPTHLETAKALVAALERQALLEAKIEQDKPAVKYYADIVDANGLYDMKQAAKLLGWGPNLLFAHLRNMRIFLDKPRNAPRQCYIDDGYFKVKERTFTDETGMQHIHCQPFVTPKGMKWLHEKVAPPPKKHGWPGHRPGGGQNLERKMEVCWSPERGLFVAAGGGQNPEP